MSHDAVVDYATAGGLISAGLVLPSISQMTELGGFVVMCLGLIVGFLRLVVVYREWKDNRD